MMGVECFYSPPNSMEPILLLMKFWFKEKHEGKGTNSLGSFVDSDALVTVFNSKRLFGCYSLHLATLVICLRKKVNVFNQIQQTNAFEIMYILVPHLHAYKIMSLALTQSTLVEYKKSNAYEQVLSNGDFQAMGRLH